MAAKETIIKMIQNMVGKYNAYNIFYDWIKICALSIANTCTVFHGDTWKKREEEYKTTLQKYTNEEKTKFAEMFVLLGEALQEKIEDVLGDIYMKSGCYSKELGQFFTPFHLAYLNAEVGMTDIGAEKIKINEPSTGGGSNIIAAAAVLKNKGINYQNVMQVIAQDLDWLGVYMTYVQLSLLGIDAEVAQGDTLREPYKGNNYPEIRVLKTPKRMGVLI